MAIDHIMVKKVLLISASGLLLLSKPACYAGVISLRSTLNTALTRQADTVPQKEVMEVVKATIKASTSFNEQAVANLYTPNAAVADDEPPYSWNGPTAGIQWINAVELAVKQNHIKKFKAEIGQTSFYQQNSDNVYLVIPVTYSGDLPGGDAFDEHGSFTFVLRLENNKWLIKTQVWAKGR